jgi:hypothetical protein
MTMTLVTLTLVWRTPIGRNGKINQRMRKAVRVRMKIQTQRKKTVVEIFHVVWLMLLDSTHLSFQFVK